MKKYLFFAIILGADLYSQPDTLWTKTFGGDKGDCGYYVQQTADGGYIIVGETHSFGVGASDVYLIRTNSRGDTLWTKTFGGSRSEFGSCIQLTGGGGYIMVGRTESFGAGEYDVYLIRTDAYGNLLGAKTFGGNKYDFAHCIQPTIDGGYIIVGGTNSFGAGEYDVYLIKTNSYGDTLWTKTFGGRKWEWGYYVQQTTDDGYIIVGRTDSYGAGEHDVYLIKTNSQGGILWTKTFGGKRYDFGRCVRQTADEGYIIVGGTNSFGAGEYDIYLIKTNANGDTLWTKTFGGNKSDLGENILQTDGGYIIVGGTWSYGVGASDVYLIGINNEGDTLWTKTFGGDTTDHGFCIQQTIDKGYIIVGRTIRREAIGRRDEVYLIKTKPLGVEEINKHTSIELNCEIKKDVLVIEYILPNYMKIKLAMYDIAGNLIKIIEEGEKPSSKYTAYVDIKTLKKGIYFIKLQSITSPTDKTRLCRYEKTKKIIKL